MGLQHGESCRFSVRKWLLNKGGRRSDVWFFLSPQQHSCKALRWSGTAQGPGCAKTSTVLPQRPPALLVKERGRANTTVLHCRGGEEGSQWSEWEGNQGKSAAWDTGETEEAEDVNTDEVLVKRRGGWRREVSAQQQVSTAGQETNPSHTSTAWGKGEGTREKHGPKNT